MPRAPVRPTKPSAMAPGGLTPEARLAGVVLVVAVLPEVFAGVVVDRITCRGMAHSLARVTGPHVNLPDWLERMLPFRGSLIAVDGRKMHVMESGPPDARPVLLLHGNPTWGFVWRKVALALARD